MSTPSLQRALKYDFSLPQEKNRGTEHREQPDVDNVKITPSQADGDRMTIERDIREEDSGADA